MSASTGPASILVVDEEPDVAGLLVDVLSEDGHGVDVVDTAVLALDRLRQTPYDLVISDLQMPDLVGRAFYHEVVRQYPALRRRFLFVSADVQRSAVHAFLLETGAPAFPKPFDVVALRQTVRAMLGRE